MATKIEKQPTAAQLYRDYRRAKEVHGPRHAVTWEIRRQFLLAQAEQAMQEGLYQEGKTDAKPR